MKISFFETVRYRAPQVLPPEWPVPSGAYDRDAGAQAYREMIERLEYVEELGFDWVSVSEHHYSPRILTPSPIVSAAFIAAHLKRITIALLGPIVPHRNPVRVAEELAMLDTMAQGRLVVGLLRGTANEAMTYDLNPQEARERTDEGMELILKAWTEPQPFGWQGRHFQYRTVSIWPRPLQQPHPPTFALGTSRESCEFAARHHLGCGVSYGPFEVMAKATRYYREQCARHGWQPSPEQIIYRANMLVAETDEDAHALLAAQPNQAPFTMRAGVRDAVMALDSRNIAGEARAPVVTGALPRRSSGAPTRSSSRCGAVARWSARASSTCPCTRRAPAISTRSCARWSCSARRCCRVSARSERGGRGAGDLPRGPRRGERRPDPVHGSRAGDAAGAPPSGRWAAPHPRARPVVSPLPRCGARDARLRSIA
jgi:alkanesulfonate monooxygenase SsuD/methylene tetrahydromethanopterin reductase-like flavin-dependent oxidoreductase (luciferase family)